MIRILIALSVLSFSAAFCADYWPMVPGATFHYTNGDKCMDVVLSGLHSSCDIQRNETIYYAGYETCATPLWGKSTNAQAQGEVLEATSVSVPAGTFDVIKVTVTSLSLSNTYWLHRDLGPVKIDPGGWELVYWTGVVPNKELSWGDVKALYR